MGDLKKKKKNQVLGVGSKLLRARLYFAEHIFKEQLSNKPWYLLIRSLR